MFLQMLSDKDQECFLEVATLICLSDNPLHWDGKSLEELTGNVDPDSAGFTECDFEEAVLNGFRRECGKETIDRLPLPMQKHIKKHQDKSQVEVDLLNKIREIPLFRINSEEERIKAAAEALSDILDRNEFKKSAPSASKVMLYELMLLALADGGMSTIEEALLKNLSAHCAIDDCTFEDLQERASSMNHEAAKTLSLILE